MRMPSSCRRRSGRKFYHRPATPNVSSAIPDRLRRLPAASVPRAQRAHATRARLTPACAQCGYPAAKLRSYNWGLKAKRRKTTGTGRCENLKSVHRRFKNGFREGGVAPKKAKATTSE